MMYMWKPDVGWVNITEFCFLGINPFPRFDMVLEAIYGTMTSTEITKEPSTNMWVL